MSSARALPAAPPHPELAALLLAFGDPPVGEGDAALGVPRLVLADWLGECRDGREAEVRDAALPPLVLEVLWDVEGRRGWFDATPGDRSFDGRFTDYRGRLRWREPGRRRAAKAGTPQDFPGLARAYPEAVREYEARARRAWRRRLLALFPEVLLSWPDPARPGGLVLCPARLLVPEEPPA